MENIEITENIKYIGANDKNIDLFESQYVLPNGISYNSYLIIDEKIAIMDTIDKRKTDEWDANLERELAGRKPDYLVVSHLEPDHAYNIKNVMEKYPDMKIVGNAKTFAFIPQFFRDFIDLEDRKIEVKEGDELCLGEHTLKFIMAPMVHWPEVMMTYEEKDKILFSADGFGKFGALDVDESWDDEARRYYFNIVGKYGIQVQSVLKKVSNLDIEIICPLHGPILKENLNYYIEKYDVWSSYISESNDIFVAYCSIHGNTQFVAEKMKEILKEKTNRKIVIADLAREDWSKCVGEAFKYSNIILAAPTYNMEVFTPMKNFLNNLKDRNFQNKKVGIIENGTWAPNAANCMKKILGEMKNIELVEPIVTIKSTLSEKNIEELNDLVDNFQL